MRHKEARCSVLLDGEEMLLAELNEPEHFGEIALLSTTKSVRTASVTVMSETALTMIMHKGVQRVCGNTMC